MRFTFTPSGPFSLAAAKRFLLGFPAGDPPPDGDGLVWAFLSDANRWPYGCARRPAG